MLLEELEEIPGGSKLPKVRQLSRELRVSFDLAWGVFDKKDDAASRKKKT